ncbi:phage tail sheath C-terminal domain-containing protein [Flavobacterium sp. M31R6]|uniref:phage tail sheath family protein n=1 Tax=Flavobacterium sp. M31R6 TaxID=2739062 RepID=UPI00156951AC|nr:phage tail sheath C-terminal domain-containing protein [Flavobacterium sp. M31R6]QKJ63524.1 phage tail sheath family protein [Flavobacterium sp. M31R6]
MDLTNRPTPGVFINEINAFQNSAVGVPTAIPAFIGYTPQALHEGKSYLNVPVKITSFADFQDIFCLPDHPLPASPTKQYSPEYYLVQQKSQPEKGDFMLIFEAYYSIVPDPYTIYYLYNSVKLFYENGGGEAYIVSVGTYGPSSKKPMDIDTQIVNPNVVLNDLLEGLQLLVHEPEPTLYICPEATLLSLSENGELMESMLLQCTQMQTAMSIFDIIGGNDPDPVLYTQDISNFRINTGSVGLNYGMAYYPFIGTDIMQKQDIDYTNLFGGDVKQLGSVINPASNPNPNIAAIIANIQNPASTLTTTQNNNALLNASLEYSYIIKEVERIASILPASGAIAGVISMTDNQEGPWQAPANKSIFGAISLPIKISESQQANLNVDVVSGKSINAIRVFNELGILIWGARTLDGNSQDWKYIPVRRTMIFIEQSCKLAAQAYIFQPNDKNTWEAVKLTIANFLTDVWKQGGLQGASASDAFSVDCGLGTTMTGEDILNGYMTISIKVAVAHPAEFILITLQQKMESAS